MITVAAVNTETRHHFHENSTQCGGDEGGEAETAATPLAEVATIGRGLWDKDYE